MSRFGERISLIYTLSPKNISSFQLFSNDLFSKLNPLVSRNFCQKSQCTEKREINSHSRKCREINYLVKTLLSRNFFKEVRVRVNYLTKFPYFPQCSVHLSSFQKKKNLKLKKITLLGCYASISSNGRCGNWASVGHLGCKEKPFVLKKNSSKRLQYSREYTST